MANRPLPWIGEGLALALGVSQHSVAQAALSVDVFLPSVWSVRGSAAHFAQADYWSRHDHRAPQSAAASADFRAALPDLPAVNEVLFGALSQPMNQAGPYSAAGQGAAFPAERRRTRGPIHRQSLIY
jgi:hypothetical protein